MRPNIAFIASIENFLILIIIIIFDNVRIDGFVRRKGD